EHRADLLVGVSLYIVHQEDSAVPLRQRLDGAVQPGPEVRVPGSGGPADLGRVVQRHFPLAEPLHLPERVERHRDGDGPDPGAERRFAAEIPQPAEGLDEGLLDAVTGLVRVSHQAVNHSVDAVYVRVIQDALGGGVSVQYPGDQLSVVHQPPEAFKVPPARATLTREPGSGLRGCLSWSAKARSREGAEGLEPGS